MKAFVPSLKLQIMGTLMKLVEGEASIDLVADEILKMTLCLYCDCDRCKELRRKIEESKA
jgi:hypothetical protein